MSNTLTQPAIPHEPIATTSAARPSWRRWPKRLLLLLVFLWFANAAISFLIQHSSVNRKITARLEAAFGRSVDVGSYSFSLWGRPTLEADSVVVGEDPRFGHEYFLHADSLTMSLHWQSLLLGRLEFGTISLSHPSLNLVRNSEGDWNLAEWLPRLSPAPGAPAGLATQPSRNSSGASAALRFSRIDVDSGRINFKRVDEKLPFALVGVTGFLEPAGPGQWRMDLEAVPSRAAVIIQQAGMLHLSGRVGGTSSRLRPAALDLAWTDASISDVLRLFRGTDYGIRGNLALAMNARTEAQDWLLQVRAEIRQVHRWDLPSRADNPSLNLNARVTLDPEHSGFDVVEAVLESPRSNARATGVMSWSQPTADLRGNSRATSSATPSITSHAHLVKAPPESASQPALRIVSGGINMADALAWARAFHSGVSDDLALQGFANLDLTLAGWPPRLDAGTLSIASAQLTGKSLPLPVRLDLASLRYDLNRVSVLPSTISFGASGGALHIEASGAASAASGKKSPVSKITPGLHVAGSLPDAGTLISTARLLGWDISRGWDLTGPVRGDLQWPRSPYPWQIAPLGTLEFGAAFSPAGAASEPGMKSTGDTLRAPFLNLPVEQIRARVDLKPNARHIALASARAFGAAWSGTFDRHDSAFGSPPDSTNAWRFDLAADKLDAADIDRWLNPRWRESFVDRVLPFLNSRPLATARPEYLSASGSMNVDEFTFAPFVVRHLSGRTTIDGRHVAVTNASAQFFKGDLSGSLAADLDSVPSYRINLNFANVDVASLTAGVPSLADQFVGSGYGKVFIIATGATRADLVSALECRGTASVTHGELKDIDLSASFAAGAFRAGKSKPDAVASDFSCAAGKLEFQRLKIDTPSAEFAGTGTIDFNRRLNLTFAAVPPSPPTRTTPETESPTSSYRIAGTLAAPEITRFNPAPPHP